MAISRDVRRYVENYVEEYVGNHIEEALRQKLCGTVSVKDFGASGDYDPLRDQRGEYTEATRPDDTSAIQAAIDSLPVGGGTVCVPPGTYRITHPINIYDQNTSPEGGPPNNRRAIRLVGGNAETQSYVNTIILWDGDVTHSTGRAMLELLSQDCIVERLSFRVRYDKSVDAAIMVHKAPEPSGICSHNTFDQIQVAGSNVGGVFKNGVVIGSGDPNEMNVEYMLFRRCTFGFIEEACVDIASANFNSKSHSFHDCGFGFANYGIRLNRGSFQTYSCSFQHLTDTAVELYSPADNILLVDSDSENCTRFLATKRGDNWVNDPNPAPTTLLGGRISVHKMPDDTPQELDPANKESLFIAFNRGGPLVIQNVSFERSSEPDDYRVPEQERMRVTNRAFRIQIGSFGFFTGETTADSEYGPVGGGVATITGCQFPNTTPFRVADQQAHLVALGNRGTYTKPIHVPNRGTTYEYFPVSLDDEFVKFNQNRGRLALGGVRGISGGLQAGKNLRGVVTFDGAMLADPSNPTGPTIPAEQIKHVSTWPYWDPAANHPAWEKAWHDEKDANYGVTLGVEVPGDPNRKWESAEAQQAARDVASSIPAGALRAQVLNRTRWGFYIRLDEPPGPSQRVAVHWQIMR